MKPPLQVISEVRELFEDESKWTQFANARNESGHMVDARSPAAVCWCLNGAIELKAGGYDTDAYSETYELIYRVETHPITLNDCDDYDAVIALLDKVINKAIAHVQQ
jgi:hypothetical protein